VSHVTAEQIALAHRSTQMLCCFCSDHLSVSQLVGQPQECECLLSVDCKQSVVIINF